MAFQLTCPCGETVYGRDEEALVRLGSAHVESVHGRSYSAEDIMSMAYDYPDELLDDA